MRLLPDENASSKAFRSALADAGHDVELSSEAVGFSASDDTIAEYAIRTRRVLVTQDQHDFRDRYLGRTEHPGVIVIYPSLRQHEIRTLVKAVDNVAATLPNTADLILSLNEFFW